METAFCIIIPKQMNPDEIKGIEKPSSRGISGVVTVSELILIDNYAGSAFAGLIRKSPGDMSFFVDIAQEALNGFLGAVGPAERPHDTRLRQGVSLTLHILLHPGGLTTGRRPG